MATTDESFLPQIVGLFYAAFDPKLGPTVLHQVPENLITSTSRSTDTSDDLRSPSSSHSRSREPSTSRSGNSGGSASGERGRNDGSRSRSRFPRTTTRSPSGSRASSHYPSSSTLLEFAPISEYVIPKKSLYGKLVTLLTTGNDGTGNSVEERVEYRVMGFPCILTGETGRYQRNEYMWNLCFVFHATSSLEAFEPVVRKCGRILRSAELDSAYLSLPQAEHTPLTAVMEQLFEDLNSYSETSIPLDGFNSLELKLFPYFPNPPECHDWHVPIALVDLNAFRDDNWDITASRVAEHIDGVNHVKRISELADADLALTRETLRHMLFYQVVMMVDIFQYSNIYTLKPSITHLASDETIVNECAPYVTRPGYPYASWPTMLSLYSRLQSGVTVHQWIEENDILSKGIDPRRFVSFGVIKGFLRRVHRWPVTIDPPSPPTYTNEPRRKVEFEKSARIGSSLTLSTKSAKSGSATGRADRFDHGLTRSGAGDSTFTLRSEGSNLSLGVSPSKTPSSITKSPSRRTLGFTNVKDSFPSVNSSQIDTTQSGLSGHSGSKRQHTFRSGTSGGATSGGGALKIRDRESQRFEEELAGYLNGMHHTDEIQVRFGMGWKELQKLLSVGEGKEGTSAAGSGREGKGRDGVIIIYR